MDFLTTAYLSGLATILFHISVPLFICFSTNYRNGEHKTRYYVLGLFFPLIVLIIFLKNRKAMYGAGMKKCPVCGRLYPKEFTYCHNCNVQLDEFDQKKSNTQKALAIISAVVIAVSFAGMIAFGVHVNLKAGEELEEMINQTEKYSFTDENGEIIFYDRNGEVYYDMSEIPYYTRDGKKYVYSNALECLSASDGSTLNIFECFVDSDGYIVKDNGEILLAEDKTEDKTQDIDENADLDDIFEKTIEEMYVPYFETVFKDKDGNVYYEASEASWNKDGKLITSYADYQTEE